MDNTSNKQDAPAAGNGRMTMILAGIAVLALAFIGTVLYMQYTEYNYYQEPPSAWPAVTSRGGVPAPETPLPPLPPIISEPDYTPSPVAAEPSPAVPEPSPAVPDEGQDEAAAESESAEAEPSAAPPEKEADSSDEPLVTETSDEPSVTETSDEPAPAPAGPAPLPSLFD